jgi:hypothetical protein
MACLVISPRKPDGANFREVKWKMIRPLFLLALIAAYGGEGLAQETGGPVFRVAIKVSGDSTVATEVESWIRHELNLLKDVTVVSSEPDYTLNAIAMVVNNKEQATVGIALTWLSLYHPKGPCETCTLVEDYRLLTFDPSDVRVECQTFVARFDSKSLEPHRKLFRKPKP